MPTGLEIPVGRPRMARAPLLAWVVSRAEAVGSMASAETRRALGVVLVLVDQPLVVREPMRPAVRLREVRAQEGQELVALDRAEKGQVERPQSPVI